MIRSNAFRTKKHLGQHFLNDQQVLQQIIDHVLKNPQYPILEIGPGLGVLTEPLLQNGYNVTAVEYDPRTLPVLQKKFADFLQKNSLDLILGDILDQDLRQLFGDKDFAVVANIPYQITAPILRLLFSHETKPQYAILMMQKEVAEKIVDPKKGSVLSLSLKLYADAEYLFSIPPSAFSPPPKVHSAVLKITPKTKQILPPEYEKNFFHLIRTCFHQKRKKLGNTITGLGKDVDIQKICGNIDQNRRPETLSLEEWVSMTLNMEN